MRTRAQLDKERAGSTDEVFDQLIALNRRAFDERRYSAAYHILAAAQSWANDNEDERQLSTIERIAKEQLQWIDLHAPRYEHSSQSAAVRGHRSIFTNLERQAHTAISRIGSRRHFENMIRARAKFE